MDAEGRGLSLPSAEATNKLLRYESHLDRELYRAMDQLERLQRQRKGENVPPPLKLIWLGGHRHFCETKPRTCLVSTSFGRTRAELEQMVLHCLRRLRV